MTSPALLALPSRLSICCWGLVMEASMPDVRVMWGTKVGMLDWGMERVLARRVGIVSDISFERIVWAGLVGGGTSQMELPFKNLMTLWCKGRKGLYLACLFVFLWFYCRRLKSWLR